MQSVLLKDLMTVDMEDLRHTGSSIIGFTILDVKNYELAKTSGEMSQVITYLYYISVYIGTYIFQPRKKTRFIRNVFRWKGILLFYVG